MPAKSHDPGAPEPATAVESEGAGTRATRSTSTFGEPKTESIMSVSVDRVIEVLRRHEEPGVAAVMVDELTHTLGAVRSEVRSRTVSDPVRAAAAQLIAGLRANRDSLPNGI